MKHLPAMILFVLATTVSAHEPHNSITVPPSYYTACCEDDYRGARNSGPTMEQMIQDGQLQRLEWAQQWGETQRLNQQYRNNR